MGGITASLARPALVFLLLLSGCGEAPEAVATSDSLRVVSLAPHLTELVYAVDGQDHLVGAVDYSDYPDPARDLPRVGDAFRIDLERLTALTPDLVLVWPGGNPAELVADLRERGFALLTIDIVRLTDVAAAMRVLGDRLGTMDVAAARADAYLRGVAALREANEGAGTLQVFHQISAQPLFTVGGDHSITELLALCGGENVFADLGELAATVTQEAVVARAPDVILSSEPPEVDAFAQWRRFQNLPAVASGQMHFVEADHVSRPGPRLLDGARAVCRLLQAAREQYREAG